MGTLLILISTAGVVALSMAVMHHAAHADRLWPFASTAGRTAHQAAPFEQLSAAELTSYVRRGLDEIAVMLAQAARQRPD
jgi:hypothetical protein